MVGLPWSLGSYQINIKCFTDLWLGKGWQLMKIGLELLKGFSAPRPNENFGSHEGDHVPQKLAQLHPKVHLVRTSCCTYKRSQMSTTSRTSGPLL